MLTVRIWKKWQNESAFKHHNEVAEKEKDKSQSPTV